MNISSSILFREDSSNTLAKTTPNTYSIVKSNITQGKGWFSNTHGNNNLSVWITSINNKNIPYAQQINYDGYTNLQYQIFNSANNIYGSHLSLTTLWGINVSYYTNNTIHFVGFK